MLHYNYYLAVHLLYDKALFVSTIYLIFSFIIYKEKSILQWCFWSVIALLTLADISFSFYKLNQRFKNKNKWFLAFCSLLCLGDILIVQNEPDKHRKFDNFLDYKFTIQRGIGLVISVIAQITLICLLGVKDYILCLIICLFIIYLFFGSVFEPKFKAPKPYIKQIWYQLFQEIIGSQGYFGLLLISCISGIDNFVIILIGNVLILIIYLAITLPSLFKHSNDKFLFCSFCSSILGSVFVDYRRSYIFRCSLMNYIQDWQCNVIILLQLVQLIYLFIQFFYVSPNLYQEAVVGTLVQLYIIRILAAFQIIRKFYLLIDNAIIPYFLGPQIMRVKDFYQLKNLNKGYKNQRLKLIIIESTLSLYNNNLNEENKKQRNYYLKLLFFEFNGCEIISIIGQTIRQSIDFKYPSFQYIYLEYIDLNYLQKKIDQGYNIQNKIKTIHLDKPLIDLEDIFQLYSFLLKNNLDSFKIPNLKQKQYNCITTFKGYEEFEDICRKVYTSRLQILAFYQMISQSFNMNPKLIVYDLYFQE